MKLGLLTAALPEMELPELAGWAAESGFGCWKWPAGRRARATAVWRGDAYRCRYARQGGRERDQVDDGRNGLKISALAYYPNILGAEGEQREFLIDHLKKVIDAAVLLEVPIVGTFVGADQTKYATENLEEFAKVWPPIVKYARERGIKIAIENCPMLWDNTWPGGQKSRIPPRSGRRCSRSFRTRISGLNYDPSHLIWQFIDEIRPIADFKDRIFHVHAKRTCISTGRCSIGTAFSRQDSVGRFPSLPGLGDVRWPIHGGVVCIGYDYVICIEHEDRTFEGTEELVKRGFYLTFAMSEPLYQVVNRNREQGTGSGEWKRFGPGSSDPASSRMCMRMRWRRRPVARLSRSPRPICIGSSISPNGTTFPGR